MAPTARSYRLICEKSSWGGADLAQRRLWLQTLERAGGEGENFKRPLGAWRSIDEARGMMSVFRF
jgi:hypothetical protein